MKQARSRRHALVPGIVLGGMLLAWCPNAFALNPALDVSQYAHTSWKSREGFTKGQIKQIAQTADGYLWLGTEFGLVRFDGVKNIPWEPPGDQHLPSGVITSLLGSSDGTLWIGTDKGLSSWNGTTLTLYSQTAGQFVFALLEDRDGAVWAGTYSFDLTPTGKLCVIHNGSVECYGADESLGRGVLSLYEDTRGRLWVSAEKGLWRWRPGPPEFLPTPGVWLGKENLAEDVDGALLTVTHSGVKRLVGVKTEAYPLPGPAREFQAHDLFRDRDGGLWIGTDGGGIVHVHHGRTDLYSKSEGLSGDRVSTLFEDREGTIWVATPNGLDRFREFAVPTFGVNQGLSNSSVWSVLSVKDGSVLFATAGGVNRWNNGQFTIHESGAAGARQSSNAPNSLFQDSRGRIWAVTQREFGYLENGRFMPLSGIPGGVARSIVEDTDGSMWIANQNLGLFHLRGSEVVERIPWDRLGHKDFASALGVDRLQGGLWIGFFQGGIAYFKDGKVQKSYGVSDGLGDGLVGDVRVDPDGTLWAATAGGLGRLKDNRIATLTRKNGLPCDAVQWLMEDNDHSFWLYTTCGLLRIASADLNALAAAVDADKYAKRNIQAMVLDVSDGVTGRVYPIGFSPQVARSADGRLWFPALDGVSVVDPKHLPFNSLKPPVHIEFITADGNTLDAAFVANRPLRLPTLTRDLRIEYTALSFVATEKVLFRYKLENWDRDWQDAGTRREASYNNVPPGNYRFRVMACNNSGVWNEAGAFLDFSIAPAYYQTTLFRVSCVAAFLLLLAALYQLRLRQVARQFNMRLEERVGERTRIARELHDTLLQSFQGVLLKFHALTYKLPERSETRQKLESVIDQAEQAITEGRDAVQGLRSSTFVTNDLSPALSTLAEELAADQPGQKAPDFRVIVEGTPRNLVPLVRDEAYRIAAEALRNAYRHAQAELIEVEILYDKRQLRVRLRDNGKGIDPSVLAEGGREGHYGLAVMQERAELVGGKVTVLSKPDSGTETELTIPGSLAYAKSPAGRWSTSSLLRR
jgi:signal transduction histidine kinase/ligand-binding sensor domain-containing protein